MSSPAPFVTVYCTGCGEPRELTARQAERAGRCVRCRYGVKVNPPDDSDRRYWLERFDDDDLSLMLSAMFGIAVLPEALRVRRQQLFAMKNGRRRERKTRPARRTSSGVSLQVGQEVA